MLAAHLRWPVFAAIGCHFVFQQHQRLDLLFNPQPTGTTFRRCERVLAASAAPWSTERPPWMSFFHGYIVAREIEAAAVFSAWFAERLWQVIS